MSATVAGAAFVAGAGVLVLLHLVRGLDYWNYSEGVYALSARLLLQGDDLYGHVVSAQPPWQYLFGAAVLRVHDSIGFLRLAVGAVQLAAGLLAARAVWRLTSSRLATVAAPACALLTPWAVREHGALTPELLAPVLLLGAALLSTTPRWVPAAACLAAAAPFLKWPYVVAVVAVVALSADPRRAARWALGALVVQAAVFSLAFGSGLWDQTVLAQLGSGRRGLDVLKGVWGQAAWSLVGLVGLAVLAVVRREQAADPRLLRVLAGLGVAMLLTLATNTKEGTGLSILVPVEAVLLPLALTGAVLCARAGGSRIAVLGVVVALAFTFGQRASLLASPRTATPFLFPSSERGAWGRAASEAEIDRQVAAARRCPAGAAYSGPPFVAFVARRPMPDGQPDQFLPAHSSRLSDVLARMQAVRGLCP